MKCLVSVPFAAPGHPISSFLDTHKAFIKSIDPYHMVSPGVEGFFNHPNSTDWAYNGADGVDFDALLKLPNIDYGTFHT